MKEFFDSNVLIAAIHEGHVSHSAARRRFDESANMAVISQHGLLETFAILTSLPTQPRMSPAFARTAIEAFARRMHVVELTPQDYSDCLDDAQRRGVAGGTIYDLLHVHAVIKCGADKVITLNRRHFDRLLSGSAIRVVEP